MRSAFSTVLSKHPGFCSLKVLVVSSKYPPEYSGSGLRAHRTYLRLKEKYDINFEVICSSTGSNRSEAYQVDGVYVERIVSRRMRDLNRNLVRTPLRRFANAVLSHAEARSVRRALRGKSFDVIHTFGYSPATATAVRWSRVHHTPLVIELVNSGATPYQYLPGMKRFSPYDLGRQSVIVAISKNLGDICNNLGLVDNVWIRPNPVDTSGFVIATKPERLAARRKISSVSETDVLIVYVAKYLSRKNHSFLLEVIAKLPARFKLVLAGPAVTDLDLVPGLTADQIQSLTDRARQLEISDRVEITHGFVDMAEYLAAADIFCFPAHSEGLGTPLLESISAGVPVIANADEPSFQEWIVEGANGYLRPLNAESWAEAAILAASFDESKKSTMSAEIKEPISVELIDEQYMKLLNAVFSTAHDLKVNVDEVLAL